MSADYNQVLPTNLNFEVGEGNGTEECISVQINEDQLIECDETFRVVLSFATSLEPIRRIPTESPVTKRSVPTPQATTDCYILGNSATVVTITDNDGKFAAPQ